MSGVPAGEEDEEEGGNMSDDKQRAMMAAHLCDELGRKARQGWRFDWTADVARRIVDVSNRRYPASVAYHGGLMTLGLTPEQIEAAVASIDRGEWPANSLAGNIEQMRANAERGAESTEFGTHAHICYRVTEDMACTVLDLLGVKP